MATKWFQKYGKTRVVISSHRHRRRLHLKLLFIFFSCRFHKSWATDNSIKGKWGQTEQSRSRKCKFVLSFQLETCSNLPKTLFSFISSLKYKKSTKMSSISGILNILFTNCSGKCKHFKHWSLIYDNKWHFFSAKEHKRWEQRFKSSSASRRAIEQ